MPKNTFRMLMAALAGSVAFIAALLLLDIPARIITGNHAQIAIQFLDAMRPPMLAIEKAEGSSSMPAAMATFTQSATELRKRVAQYLEASQYNQVLHEHVIQLSRVIDKWLNNEKALWEYRISLVEARDSLEKLKQLELRHEAAIDEFLNAMEVLALGEQPIHQDIDRGRQASQILQILAILLVLYLLSLIILFQHMTRKALLSSFHEVQQARHNLAQQVSVRTQELERSNKELESFSYAVSHDLRAPLRSINGFSEALLEDNSDQLDDTGKDYLRRVSAAARHMGELIDAMLVLSRVTRKDIRHSDVDLSKAVTEIAGELHNQDPSRTVEWRISDNLHTEGDIDLLHIALENLLGNAWKYSSRNTGTTSIEFGAMEQKGEQVFFVRDNGCGFNTDYSDKLFMAFQRLHGKEYEGTGIGLATVQRIIQRHQGRVWAESTMGEGSTFYFTLG
ncbi:phospho-acceptor domain-containing protein [Thiogranum longum]|uniref:histidine kinase n=1 Tax=Thiogranum longum TaxID=1537524 RepID=A0A4R1HAL1_9GAMM|nr:ATP-binding protein [Thiogranum longum]TCK17611.1 phospho-acceptor domain-containing protein [Thiogranum longum]